jgi:hypothetical protein
LFSSLIQIPGKSVAKATAPGQDECAIDWCRADCGCFLGFEKRFEDI